MKAKDLRLGNYFQSNIIQQVQIEHLEFLLNDKLDHSGMQPIPLSEEWLLKMGFLPSRLNIKNYIHPSTISFELRNVSILDGGFKIRIGVDEAFSFKAISGEIQFVHQLQNIFHSLTGEELTIKE